jgi:hypothetical protein
LIPDVRDAAGPPEPPVGPFLGEDRIAMIETVEHLRETKRVLRQPRELQRADDLIDDLVET